MTAAVASRALDVRDLRGVPKVELHRHLEGAVRLPTVFDLSREAGLQLPADTIEGLAAHALIREPVDDLAAALRAFALTQSAVRTYDAVRRITREAIEDLAGENVRLAELRFSPHFLCEPGELDWDLAMEAILEGRGDAERAGLDVAVGFIAIFSRNYGEESARQTVAFALRHREALVGFDVAGPEVGFPPRMYQELLRPLRDSGLGLTVHYGESGPSEYPREAVEVLEPTRLGHGLSVAWDPAVTRLVAEREVTLEMCPTSNWLSKGVASVRQHPIARLLHGGVRVTLNTDDPGLMGIDLVHEWDVARDHLEFRAEDFAAVTRNALEASFLPDAVKGAVRARHFAWCDRSALPVRPPELSVPPGAA